MYREAAMRMHVQIDGAIKDGRFFNPALDEPHWAGLNGIRHTKATIAPGFSALFEISPDALRYDICI
jgi:hypothetical protein